MQELIVFQNENFKMRTIEIESKPFVCLSDICNILDIKNPRDVKSRLKQDGVVTTDTIDNIGRKIPITFIDESNLYKMIFQSRKPEAEKFTEWVTNEVLPSIRKNGGYISNQENLSDNELMAKALLVAQNTINSKTKQLEIANRKIEEDSGKVSFANSVMQSKNCISINCLSKIISQNGCDIGEKRLFQWLRDNGFLITKKGVNYNTPTQKSMDLGLFIIKETVITKPSGEKFTSKTSLVTGKGQVYLMEKYIKDMNDNIERRGK